MRLAPAWSVVLRKRLRFAATALLLLFLIAFLCRGAESTAHNENSTRWVSTWACSPQLADASADPSAPGFSDSTLRQIIHVSVGGSKVRVRFSNAFGKTALRLVSAHIAKAGPGGTIQTGTDKALVFDGQSSVSVPQGALMYSDPVDIDLPPLSDLAVTMYVKNPPDGVTTHAGSRATSYWASGDVVSFLELPSAQTIDHWYFLNGVDVLAPKSSAAVVILGDSITDGRGSTINGNSRWPDVLARRLHANKKTANVAVLNEGIGGNRLVHDGLGPNALSRLDRDVLSQAGVRWLVLFEGANDIGTCTHACDSDSNAREIIAAYRQIILRAHSHDIRVYGATITPFGGHPYSTPESERARETVNQWIRTSGAFDAVIDFDVLARDANNHSQLSPTLDSGDHLHLSDDGYKFMAQSINLRLFAK